MTQITKLIEYAYPTSTTAIKAGMGKTGSYFVSYFRADTFERIKILAYFGDAPQDAKRFADSLPEQYHWMEKYNEHIHSIITNVYNLPNNEVRRQYLQPKDYTHYQNEFYTLIENHGKDRVFGTFQQGINGYIDSRVSGCYSFDSCNNILS